MPQTIIIPKFGHMAKWDSPNIAILMMVALQPPHFSIAVYSPGSLADKAGAERGKLQCYCELCRRIW